MKVLIFEAGKGLASYTCELANNLSKLGINVFYMSSKSNHRQEDLMPEVKNYCILDDYNSDYKRFSIKWIVNRFYVIITNLLRRNIFIRKHKIDVVNIHATIPLIEYFLLKILIPSQTKYVMTVHNVVPHAKSFFDKGFRSLLKKQNALIVHTSENVQELKNLFNLSENIYEIPHGVDFEYEKINVDECRKKLQIQTNKPVLLFFGAIKRYKGLDILIKSLAGINCFLLIAGHIEKSFKEYSKLLEEYNIDYKCFVNFIPEEDIPIYFQAANIAVLPYVDFHSQSGVLLQISKYGLPLVATDVGPFESYARKYGNALICKKNDVDSLKNAIIQLLCDKDLQNQMKKASMKIVEDHSWPLVAQKYNDVFLNL